MDAQPAWAGDCLKARRRPFPPQIWWAAGQAFVAAGLTFVVAGLTFVVAERAGKPAEQAWPVPEQAWALARAGTEADCSSCRHLPD